MRSSVVEPKSSATVQGQRNQPQYRPHVPHSQRPYPQPALHKPKFRLVLAPAEGWFALVCLAVAAYCVVYAITAVKWVDNTFILNWSAAAGLIIGVGIAKIKRFPQGIMHLAACLTGHWLSIWLTSAMAFHVPWGSLIANIGAVITDPTRINNSAIVFLFYLSFLCFFLGYFGAWLTYRAHLPWLVAIVYCSILLINLSYVKQDVSFIIGVMLVALILLIARVQLAAHLVEWQSLGLYTDRTWLRGITARIMQITSFMVVLILAAGWLFPVLDQPSAGATFWDGLDNAWVNVTQGHVSWGNPASLIQPYQAPTNFFGDQLTIAGSVHLPTGEVMNYTSSAAPQYLAGFTYDHFDGHTWTSLSSSTNQNYEANAPLPTDINLDAKTITTSVTVVQPPEGTKHYLFAPTQPSSIDISSTLYGDQMISAWAQADPMTKGEHYQVISLLSTALPQHLSSVPLPRENAEYWHEDTNYTTLMEYYVQLPGNLSPQVWKTTQQWTRGATNAYEALRMLEAHLSDETQFTYALDNPAVPANTDAVSWLLQTRRGYCTYYATAMTTMARQLGIPTRIVNGFSQGHLDTQRKVWVIDGSDAHSWVQAYFPGFGWINFDPTPGFPLHGTNNPQPTTTPAATPHPTQPPAHSTPPSTSKQAHPTPPAGTRSSGDPTTPDATSQVNFLSGLSLTALICSLLVLLIAFARYRWRSLYPDSTLIAGTFWRLCLLASWLGLAPRDWQTPYEYSRMLCRKVPQAANPLWRLTELFVRERWAGSETIPYVSYASKREMERLTPSLRRVFLRLLWMKIRIKKR
ncbi:MAG: transglutaminaseTgpA domain-containing protein [Ktedonobacteraceae bacterium]